MMALFKSRRMPITIFALYVPLQAKPGKEKEVADFLRSAVSLVNAEPGTIAWFAIQEGPSSFAIFDTFDDEAGREAHLNGKVAACHCAKLCSARELGSR
jgi:quinol monooxygenase YgiN